MDRWRWGALVLFVLLALLHTYPLVTDPASLSRNDNADTILNTWIVSWVAQQVLADPAHLFDANIFHPQGYQLARSEPLIVPGLMAIPIRGVGASPVLTYNVLLLVGFALTGFVTYLVVFDWTGDHAAGVLAGAVLAFNAHTLTRLPHLQAIHAYWLPLALWALDGVLCGRRGREMWWLCLAVSGAALTSGYLAVLVVFALMATAGSRPLEWWGRNRLRVVVRLAAAGGITVMVTAAVLWPYGQVAAVRPLDGLRSLSATLWSYVATASRVHYAAWSHHIFPERTEDLLFPGLTALALAGLALTRGWREEGGRRRRSCVVILIVGLVMSLGTATPVYAWIYHAFPPMGGIRAPARFGYLVIAAVALLAGYGLSDLRRRLSPVQARAVGFAMVALITIESVHAPIRYVRSDGVSSVYRVIAEDTDDVAVLELPLYRGPEFYRNAPYLLASIAHWKPLVNGYSGSRPATYDRLTRPLSRFPSNQSVRRLRRLGVRYVVAHVAAYDDSATARRVFSELKHPALELVAKEGDDYVFRIRRVRPIDRSDGAP